MSLDLPIWRPVPRPDPWADRPAVDGLQVVLLRPTGLLGLRCAPARTRPAAFEATVHRSLGSPCPAAVGDTTVSGDGLVCVRTRPSELLLLALGGSFALLDALQQAADTSSEGLVSAARVDDAWAVVQMSGARVRPLLHRLADASSLPTRPGSASRLRCQDVPATLLWLGIDEFLLLVDAAHVEYLALWIDHFAPMLGSLDADVRSPVQESLFDPTPNLWRNHAT